MFKKILINFRSFYGLDACDKLKDIDKYLWLLGKEGMTWQLTIKDVLSTVH